jgi:hypothetical protein
MDALQQFSSLTQNLVSFVNSQVGSFGDWQNVPGGLSSIHVSSAGYVWGYNASQSIYVCKQPCTGDWQIVSGLTPASIQSLQVDTTNVYVLFTDTAGLQSVAVRSVDGSGSWTLLSNGVAGKPSMTSLGVTNTFLWVSGNQTFHCTKPCTTNAWIEDTSLPLLSSLSSSGQKLYGLGPDPTTGKTIAYGADETGENLQPVAGLAGMTPMKVNGESDQTTLLAVGSDSKLYGCAAPCTDPSSIYAIGTQGNTPTDVSIKDNQIWMVTANNGPNGNIFQRLDTPDSTSILKQTSAIDSQRDEIVKGLETQYIVQTATETAQRQVQNALGIVNDFVENKKSGNDISTVREQIKSETDKRNSYIQKLYPLQIVAFALLLSVLVYGVLGLFFPVDTLIAVILTIGLGAAIYFSVTNNTNGQSTVQSILPTPR